MSPRPRRPKNRALPQNLYPTNGGRSFMYQHPVTGRRHGMGSNKAEAIEAAKELNALLMKDNDLVAKVLGQVTVTKHVEWFFQNVAPEREYKPSTLEMYQVQSRKLIAAMGDVPEDHAEGRRRLALALAGMDDDEALLLGLGGDDLVARGLLLAHLLRVTRIQLGIAQRGDLFVLDGHCGVPLRSSSKRAALERGRQGPRSTASASLSTISR